MARLITCGFELNNMTAGAEFDFSFGGASISTSHVRSGSYAGRITSGATNNYFGWRIVGSDAVLDVQWRFYIYIATMPSADTIICFLGGVGTGNCALSLLTTGKLQFSIGDTTQSPAMSLNRWYRVEVKVNMEGVGSNDTLEGKLDGTVFATSTTADITAASILYLGSNITAGSATSDLYYDDIALNDNTGSIQNSYPGEGKVAYLFPTLRTDVPTTGDSATWTIAGSAPAATNYESVQTLDEGTTIVQRTTTTIKVDDYRVTDPLVAGIGRNDSVTCVQISIRGGATAATDSAGRRVYARLKSASSGTVFKSAGPGIQATTSGVAGFIKLNVNGTYVTNSSTGITYPAFFTQTDPTTTLPFTVTGANSLQNLQIGMENENSATTETHITAVWAIVEYVQRPNIPSIRKIQAVNRSAVT